MEIIIGDVQSKVNTTDKRVVGIIKSVCSARPEGYQFMPRYKSGRWDGYISLSSMMTFPTGLLKRVYNALKHKGYTNIRVLRKQQQLQHYEVTHDILNGITLRDYQIDAANRLLNAKRGIAKMATNSGKTEVIAAIIKAYNIPASVVIVTRKELMYQTADRLGKRLGIEVGMFGDGQRKEGIVSVCMIQTLAAMEQYELDLWFGNNQVIIIDEAHHGSAEKMMEVLSNIPGYNRFGFSGTPLRDKILPDLKLISQTCEIIVEVSNDMMIASGYSAKPCIFVHKIASTQDEGLSYSEIYDKYIVHNEYRNAEICKLASANTAITLVLVARIEHGNILQQSISGSQFINGSDSMDDRLLALENMRAGVSGIYIATSIFDEGIDVPNIDNLILAGGGKSPITLLQRIGRGLRKKEGENVLTVHDFYDEYDYLETHSAERMKVYAKEGFELIEL